MTTQSDQNQSNKPTDFGRTDFPISERDLKRGMRLFRLGIGARSILASWNSNQSVTCIKERDSIMDIWPLRVFKPSNSPLFFAPHLCNLKGSPFFFLPLGSLEISNHMRPRSPQTMIYPEQPKAICDITTEILQWISTISFIVLCIQNTQLLYTYIYLYISHFTFTTFITCITQCSEMNIEEGGSKTISFK